MEPVTSAPRVAGLLMIKLEKSLNVGFIGVDVMETKKFCRNRLFVYTKMSDSDIFPTASDIFFRIRQIPTHFYNSYIRLQFLQFLHTPTIPTFPDKIC